MREIKYRVWDRENKVWLNDLIELTLSSEGRVVFVNNFLPPFQPLDRHCYSLLRDSQNVDLVQYTGLKDKNGKEIYEGELIEYPVTSSPLEIIWDDFNCGFMLRDSKGLLMKMPSRETMHQYSLSIGNIYENPELLEGK